MGIRQKLIDDERDDLTKDVDDLDAAYLQQMKEAGIDAGLLEQFADFMKTEKKEFNADSGIDLPSYTYEGQDDKGE